jgi:hypothetical protein
MVTWLMGLSEVILKHFANIKMYSKLQSYPDVVPCVSFGKSVKIHTPPKQTFLVLMLKIMLIN